MKVIIKKKKILKEESVPYDDAIYEVKIKIHLPKTATDDTGVFIGLDRLKNDIRGLLNVTVVSTVDSNILPKAVIAVLLIKINMRTIKDTDPYNYVKKVLVPSMERFFAHGGGFGFANRPKILKVSEVVEHFPTDQGPF